MDLNFTTGEESFRSEVRTFLANKLPTRLSDKVASGKHLSKADMQEWHAILNTRGWLANHWPEQYGGPGWSAVEKFIFEHECCLASAPRVVPFGLLLTGVMIALYGGYATPSETAGLGAILALALIACIYTVWRWNDLVPILNSTLRESTMLMMIIGMSLLYSYVMSYLHISQATAQAIVALGLSKWPLLFIILLMVVVLGFFLPPVSIILMTAPIILPPLKTAGFDLIWFGVVMTIVMEMGLIHPPVGLNIFVIKNIAPDIPLKDIIWGVMPFVGLMILAVLLLCVFPQIATWLPTAVMG